MSIVTKKGDKGETRLLTGQSIQKDDLRVEAYGTMDELNTFIGLARSAMPKNELNDDIKILQKELVNVMAELASDGKSPLIKPITLANVNELEKKIGLLEAKVRLPKEFIIFGDGHISSSALDVSRAVCRRLERIVLKLYRNNQISEHLYVYINRLSDYLFLLSFAAKGFKE